MTGIVVCECGHAGRLHDEDGCRLCDCGGARLAEVEVPDRCGSCLRPMPHTDAELAVCARSIPAELVVPSVEEIVAEVLERRSVRDQVCDELGIEPVPAALPAPEPLVARTDPGSYPCPTCPRTFDTPQGVGPHRRKAHGYVKPAKSRKTATTPTRRPRPRVAAETGYIGRHRAKEAS